MLPEQQTPLEIERARVRDLLLYYKPKIRSGQPSISTASACPPDAVPEKCSEKGPAAMPGLEEPKQADHWQMLNHDSTLTAFAQLGAWRLNCERSFISLMDHEYQYVLAEATRSVSLIYQDQCEPDDEVYMGPRIIDFGWGVCPNTIQVFTAKDGSLNISTEHITANPSCYVMNDLSAIDSFKDRPYVADWPHMRFYAEVPITSPTGHVIGTYCVIDNKPRDGLDEKGLVVLTEIAAAIMTHLELVQMQEHLHRADEMLKGLGMFVEKKSPHAEWELFHGNSSTDFSRLSSLQPGKSYTFASASRTANSDHHTTFSSTVNTTPAPASKVASRVGTQNENADRYDDLNAAESTKGIPCVSSGQITPRNSEADTTRQRGRGLTMGIENPVFDEPLISNEMQRLFSHACYRIREGLDLDGVIFIDACFQDAELDHGTVAEEANTEIVPVTSPSASDEWTVIQSSILTGPNPRPDPSTKNSETSDRAKVTDVLGHSVRNLPQTQNLPFATGQIPLKQSTLRSLLRSFREGCVFAYDRGGIFLQTAEWKQRSSSKKINLKQSQALAVELLKFCPDAKSIMFFPLWDTHYDQWFAGTLAWTTNYTRVIRPADVNYLAAFSSCVMSEKSRLDVRAADREKLDFVSSVSHEVRSPLHGVLASAEALVETSTGLLQDDMIRTITVCGEVLLDTMDQILDYAKLNKPLRSKKNGSNATPGTLSRAATADNAKPLDLSEVIEATIESVYFGHSFRNTTFNTFEDLELTGDRQSAVTSQERSVILLLNIDKEDSWIYKSQVSAWTRILMNIFGNALKYTNNGFVSVSLRSDATSSAESASRLVTLEVEDSGKGMSEKYLKHHVFTPFVQEDHLAVGTGLGLSIVRQLVRDIRGQIDIQSEVKHGTKVAVSVPLHAPSNPLTSVTLESESLINDVKLRTKGLQLCLVNFDYYPDVDEAPTGILSAHSRSMLALKKSLTRMAIDWFDMKVTTSPDLASAAGDILVGLHSKLFLLENHVSPVPLVIFEDSVKPRLLGTQGIQYLTMPAAPHKFARVLKVSLDNTLSVVPSISEYISAGSPSLPRLTPPSANDTVSSPPSPRPSPELSPELDQAETIPTIEVDASRPILMASEPAHSVPLSDVSVRLLDQKAVSAVSSEVITVSPITISPPPLSLQRSKALLVEDNAVNLKILMHSMKSAKQNYDTATNGLEALEQFQANPGQYRVVFMDLSMPIMDGLTSTRHIRAYEEENALPRTRIVALTCFSSEKYQREAIDSGIDLYIVKPIPMRSLKPILALDPENFDNSLSSAHTPSVAQNSSPPLTPTDGNQGPKEPENGD
ncbi:hypothetical protein VTL71DRAFT_1982 [Oculimacula yallundae]|uniref:LOV domain-containing protein n=1 Tax=Oculimacula yallundae TaxID=86028 RepID=A0ABR4CD10_9HELO